jgi:hypothetical protein
VISGQDRVQAGARAEERDPAGGVVLLTVIDAPTYFERIASYTVR